MLLVLRIQLRNISYKNDESFSQSCKNGVTTGIGLAKRAEKEILRTTGGYFFLNFDKKILLLCLKNPF